MRRAAASFAILIACGTTGANVEVGTRGWLEKTRQRFLAFDADGSGLLDAAELERLPCEVFSGPANEWSRAFSTSFSASHGLGPGLLFRGEVLGFARESAATVPALEARCGLKTAQSAGLNQIVAQLARLESAPTSALWDHEVATLLVANHDRDASGLIDSRLEVQDISCEVLAELERQVRSVADVGVATLYGVEPGLVWIGASLGFGDAVRALLGERFEACEIDSGFH